MRRSFKEKLIIFLVRVLSRPLLLTYRHTLSLTVKNTKYVQQCRSAGKNILFCFWHENMILPMLLHEFQGIHVLVSQHFDGEVIATILKMFGYPSIRGSSTRGGKEAYNEMKKLLKSGKAEMAFTPDGPRGPRRKAKLGIVRLAAETGSPIIPIAVAATRYKRLGSWDRLLLILPFSRCVLVYHEPLYVPPDTSSQNLEGHADRLTRITEDLESEAEACLLS